MMPYEVDGPHVGKLVINLYGKKGVIIDDLATQYWIKYEDGTEDMAFKKECKLIK